MEVKKSLTGNHSSIVYYLSSRARIVINNEEAGMSQILRTNREPRIIKDLPRSVSSARVHT